MQITSTTLRRIIKEEIEAVLNEEKKSKARKDAEKAGHISKAFSKENEFQLDPEYQDRAKAMADRVKRLKGETNESELDESPEDYAREKERLRKLSGEKGPAARKAAEEAAKKVAAEFEAEYQKRTQAMGGAYPGDTGQGGVPPRGMRGGGPRHASYDFAGGAPTSVREVEMSGAEKRAAERADQVVAAIAAQNEKKGMSPEEAAKEAGRAWYAAYTQELR